MKSVFYKVKKTVMATAVGAIAAITATSAFAENEKLRVQHYPGLLIMAPVYVAAEQGFFEDNGLDVELIGIPTGTVSIAALTSDSVDVIFQVPDFIMDYNRKGPPSPGVMVSGLFNTLIYDLVGLNEIIDNCPEAKEPYPAPLTCLKGRRIGITALGSNNYFTMLSFLNEGGMGEDDVSLLALGGSSVLGNSLRAGEADFILATEPAITYTKDILGISSSLVDLKLNPLMSVWIGNAAYAKQDSLEARPEVFEAFWKSIGDAVEFISDPANDAESAENFVTLTDADPELALKMIQQNRERFSAEVDCQAIDNIGQWLVEAGRFEESEKPSCESFVAPYAR